MSEFGASGKGSGRWAGRPKLAAPAYDLPAGVYTVRATSVGGRTGSRDDVRVTSSGESVYVMTLYPPEWPR